VSYFYAVIRITNGIRQILNDNMMTIFLTLLVTCSIVLGANFDLVGVNDFNHVNEKQGVWLNGEPIFILYKRPSHPRMMNSYPIVKGKNILEVRPVKEGSVSRVMQPHFFYANESEEKAVVLKEATEGRSWAGGFFANDTYQINGRIDLSPLKQGRAKSVKSWVANLIEALRSKDQDSLMVLYDPNTDSETITKGARAFLRPDALCVEYSVFDTLSVLQGESLILVYGVHNLAKWKVNDSTYSADSVLFAETVNGVYAYFAAGEWLKLNLD